MASLHPRRIAGVITSLLLAAVAITAFASPAQAEEGYEYWMYFHLDGDAWAFAQTGAAEHQPEDGDVEGFRYGVSTANAGIEPRADLAEVNFDTVCADAEATEGQKRVAVVLDYGTVEGSGSAPEPRAECATVDEGASTQDVLDAVAQVRVENNMTCALDGYPASGCGEPVPNADVPADEEPVAFALPSAEADEDPAGGSALSSIVIVALVVVLIAIAAFALNRRRSTTA